MNFSLIDGCGTCENNICGCSFFWSGTYEFTNIIIVTKKINKHKYKEKFVILQSIGIIAVLKVEEQGQSSTPADTLVDI